MAIAYAFQIYFDFSGYSDMAIGLGRMFGFVIPENFRSPYLSESITDFWRRWHISLSTWLRDYLYLPLGGNRLGPRRTYINLALVMLLGGLWHGAAWQFLAWGGYHGSLLAFERWIGKKSPYEWLPRPGRIAVTFVLVLFSWVLFRSPSLGYAVSYWGAMLGANGSFGVPALLAAEIYTAVPLTVLCVCMIISFQRMEVCDWVGTLTWRRALALAPLLLVSLGTMFTQAFNPFLYFQF
jgi:alginate O-acetyltransferase complex protein AlgI